MEKMWGRKGDTTVDVVCDFRIFFSHTMLDWRWNFPLKVLQDLWFQSSHLIHDSDVVIMIYFSFIFLTLFFQVLSLPPPTSFWRKWTEKILSCLHWWRSSLHLLISADFYFDLISCVLSRYLFCCVINYWKKWVRRNRRRYFIKMMIANSFQPKEEKRESVIN
jgi:hypothetical protein